MFRRLILIYQAFKFLITFFMLITRYFKTGQKNNYSQSVTKTIVKSNRSIYNFSLFP